MKTKIYLIFGIFFLTPLSTWAWPFVPSVGDKCEQFVSKYISTRCGSACKGFIDINSVGSAINKSKDSNGTVTFEYKVDKKHWVEYEDEYDDELVHYKETSSITYTKLNKLGQSQLIHRIKATEGKGYEYYIYTLDKDCNIAIASKEVINFEGDKIISIPTLTPWDCDEIEKMTATVEADSYDHREISGKKYNDFLARNKIEERSFGGAREFCAEARNFGMPKNVKLEVNSARVVQQPAGTKKAK